MKKILLAVVAMLVCGLAAGQRRMEPVTYYGHLYFNIDVNGHAARLAFDTGSPYLCLDSLYQAGSGYAYKNVINARMGGTGNHAAQVRAVVNEVSYTLAGQEYTTHVAPIVPLKPILGDYADGILGMAELGGKVIAIDYAGRRVGFWDSLEASDTVGYTAVPITCEATRIFVPLTVEVGDGTTIEGDALLDLGSGGTVTLTSGVAAQYGLEEVRPLMRYGMLHGGIGGESAGCFFRAARVGVGPFTLEGVTMDFSLNTEGALSSRNYLGIVGNELWERFDMILDLAHKKLYLRPNGDYGKPFEAPTLGFSYTDRSRTLGCWVVNALFAGSHAAVAGLWSGDRITAVNGRSVGEIDIEEQQRLFEGVTTVRLTLDRNGAAQEITFEVDKPKI